jgi:hypothetical protein
MLDVVKAILRLQAMRHMASITKLNTLIIFPNKNGLLLLITIAFAQIFSKTKPLTKMPAKKSCRHHIYYIGFLTAHT